MSSINKNEIIALRSNSIEMANELESKINTLQGQLLALKERIKVYDELISGSPPMILGAGENAQPVLEKQRGQRSTKSEMNRRREVVRELLSEKGPMQPRELLSMVQEELGSHFEAHHLRAVLRKYTDIFTPHPDFHGLWMTIAPAPLTAVHSVD